MTSRVLDVTPSVATQIMQSHAAAGGKLFELPTGIADRAGFFAAARARLPLDPPLASDRSWDALSDSLWQGLRDLPDERVLIVWHDARRMKAHTPEDARIARGILDDLCAQFAAANADPRKQLRVRCVIEDADEGDEP